MTLENVDYAILAILGISAAISLIRGFVKEALSMALWVVAFIVTMSFNERVAVYLVDTVDLPSMRLAIASVGLFVLTLVVGSILNYVVGALIKISGLGGLDRLLGLIFGNGTRWLNHSRASYTGADPGSCRARSMVDCIGIDSLFCRV